MPYRCYLPRSVGTIARVFTRARENHHHHPKRFCPAANPYLHVTYLNVGHPAPPITIIAPVPVPGGKLSLQMHPPTLTASPISSKRTDDQDSSRAFPLTTNLDFSLAPVQSGTFSFLPSNPHDFVFRAQGSKANTICTTSSEPC